MLHKKLLLYYNHPPRYFPLKRQVKNNAADGFILYFISFILTLMWLYILTESLFDIMFKENKYIHPYIYDFIIFFFFLRFWPNIICNIYIFKYISPLVLFLRIETALTIPFECVWTLIVIIVLCLAGNVHSWCSNCSPVEVYSYADRRGNFR